MDGLSAATRRNWTLKGVFSTALLASVVAAALVVLAMILLAEYTETRGRLLLTAVTSGGFSLTGRWAAKLYERSRYRPLPEAGMLLSLLGFILGAIGIWAPPDFDGYWKATAIVSVLAVSLNHICLLLHWEPKGPWIRHVLRGVISATALVALLVALGIILEIKSNLFWWTVVLVAILDVLGSIPALLVGWWVSSRDNQTAFQPEVT